MELFSERAWAGAARVPDHRADWLVRSGRGSRGVVTGDEIQCVEFVALVGFTVVARNSFVSKALCMRVSSSLIPGEFSVSIEQISFRFSRPMLSIDSLAKCAGRPSRTPGWRFGALPAVH